MIYWHVEKKSLCVYSQLKSCSASEVAAMIEGVSRHCTSIEVDRNYVDTHGQSLVGFAFSHLLGFRLLPRFKTIGPQRLARADPGDTGELAGLEPMLTRPIDWELIAQQYDQMVKYATALRLGTAEAEQVLRRFTRGGPKHPRSWFPCSWAGSVSDRRVGGRRFHVPVGSFRVVGLRTDDQVGAGRALTARQVSITSLVPGQSARRWSHRLRCPRVRRAGRCSSR